MDEELFRILHPDLTLKFGKSSEDNKWWADARDAGGRCIALRGKSTLAEALNALDVSWQSSRRAPMVLADDLGLKQKPSLPMQFPREILNYGLAEDLGADEPPDDQ